METLIWSGVADVKSRYGASAQLVMTVKGGSVNGFTMVSYLSLYVKWQ
jgi:hypothetical protein